MTIQNIAITNTRNFGITRKHGFTTLINNAKSKSELLTPEQKNTVQDDFNTKISEQANNIKSNFQTAKDLALTRAYYEQQQKLVDIYMQADSSIDQNSHSNMSASKALTDTYASLYHMHQSIKFRDQQFASELDTAQPYPEISPVETMPSLAQRQTDTYNNFMMPTNNSYLHLQA